MFADWVNVNRSECVSFIDLMCEYGLVPSLAVVAEPEIDQFSTSQSSIRTSSDVVDNLQGSLSVLSTDVEN
jgi:hypothetical protein